MFGSQNISQIHIQDPISNTISSAGSGLLDHILGPLGFTLGRDHLNSIIKRVGIAIMRSIRVL
jgi:hypothetical protein